jgi:hypothetical protein
MIALALALGRLRDIGTPVRGCGTERSEPGRLG